MQCGKIWNPARIRDHHLAIQDQIVRPKRNQRIRYGLELLGPVMTSACVDGWVALLEMRLCAVAVEFDFMNPTRPLRYMRTQRGEARFDKARKDCTARSEQHP